MSELGFGARRIVPSRRPHYALPFVYAGVKHTLGVGFYDHDEREIAEIFIDTHRYGTALAANAKDAAVVLSIALQHGSTLPTIDKALNREDADDTGALGEAAGVVGAALDALREARPDLFVDTGPAPALRSSNPALAIEIEQEVANLSDDDKLACTLAGLRTLKAAGYAWPPGERFWTLRAGGDPDSLLAEIERLKAENASLHDEIGALSDERTILSNAISFDGMPAVDDIEHRKGGEYAVLTRDARLAASNTFALHDNMPVTVYANAKGLVFVRPNREMTDGRFTATEPVRRDLRPIELRSLRQARAIDLAAQIWGRDAVWNPEERLRRFWEEACEVVQAFGMSRHASKLILNSVYFREPGEPEQEIGGVAFCLLSLCAAHGFDADALEVREIRRVLVKDPNVMRARHQQKVDAGLAMQAQRPDVPRTEEAAE